MNLNEISVIIPAYEPDDKLIVTLKELVKSGFTDILVVNDGSSKKTQEIFKKVEEIPECTLLVHEVNRGKGAALKTAMKYFLEKTEGKRCVVTADADGQHLTADIQAVALKSLETEAVVLGVRDFSDPSVPSRSKMGNRITSGVFRLFFGMQIQDTQTGLRAFPKKYIEALLEADGDRYEYETNMLFMINRKDIPLEQVGITTVYIDDNKSSHFRVVRDSLRVYGLILKYLLSSVAASVIDELAFFIFKSIGIFAFLPIPVTFTAAFLARLVSSMVNFWINANVVFQDKKDKKAIVRYYMLVVVQICLSAALVFAVENIFRITSPGLSTLAKVIIDTVLFFFSFRIQHKWVFNSRSEN